MSRPIDSPVSGIEETHGFLPRFSANGSSETCKSLAEAVDSCPDRSIDWDALNVFFRVGTFIGGATPFKQIRKHSPPPLFVPHAHDMSRNQALEGYIQLFREAVQNRARAGTIIGLSGGRDSRHILLELFRLGQLPDAVLSVDFQNENDAEIARQLCERIVLQQILVPIGRGAASARWTLKTCNLSSLEHLGFATMARRRDDRPLWDGVGGDVLSAGLFLEDWNLLLFREGKIDDLAERLVRTGNVSFFRDQSLFPRERALEKLRTELMLHASCANPVGSFYFWNRTRNNIGACAFALLRQHGQQTLAPYLDANVYSLLASLPAEFMLDHKFHDEAISMAFPDFRSVPYAKRRSITKATWLDTIHFMLAVARGSLSSPFNSELGLLLRAFQSLLVPARRDDIDWIQKGAAYLAELGELANGGG